VFQAFCIELPKLTVPTLLTRILYLTFQYDEASLHLEQWFLTRIPVKDLGVLRWSPKVFSFNTRMHKQQKPPL